MTSQNYPDDVFQYAFKEDQFFIQGTVNPYNGEITIEEDGPVPDTCRFTITRLCEQVSSLLAMGQPIPDVIAYMEDAMGMKHYEDEGEDNGEPGE